MSCELWKSIVIGEDNHIVLNFKNNLTGYVLNIAFKSDSPYIAKIVPPMYEILPTEGGGCQVIFNLSARDTELFRGEMVKCQLFATKDDIRIATPHYNIPLTRREEN